MRKDQSSAAVLFGNNGLLRDGIAGILRTAGFRTLTPCSSGNNLISGKGKFDHALFLIIYTGNEFNVALDQIKLLRSRHPQNRIAVVADRYRPDELTIAFQAGANAYFVEFMAHDVFIKSIELVLMGETIVPAAHLSSAPVTPQLKPDDATIVTSEDVMAPQLSSREISIVHCLIEGDSNKRIARKLNIAEATVKVHVKAILRKTRVSNRTQAAIWGMNNALMTRTRTAAASAEIIIGERNRKIVEQESTATIPQADQVEVTLLESLVPTLSQIVVTRPVSE